MLKQLILQIVRNAIPSELEFLDCEYAAHPDGVIVRIPATEYIRMMD
jgi:hypothetical protein